MPHEGRGARTRPKRSATSECATLRASGRHAGSPLSAPAPPPPVLARGRRPCAVGGIGTPRAAMSTKRIEGYDTDGRSASRARATARAAPRVGASAAAPMRARSALTQARPARSAARGARLSLAGGLMETRPEDEGWLARGRRLVRSWCQVLGEHSGDRRWRARWLWPRQRHRRQGACPPSARAHAHATSSCGRRVACWTCGNVAPRAALTPHRAGATCRRARNSRRGMT